MDEPYDLDLGHGHYLRFNAWAPDRSIASNAERYRDIPDIPRFGAMVYHTGPDGKPCCGAITFDSEVARRLHELSNDWYRSRGEPERPYVAWTVESWEPLTVSPSLLCKLPLTTQAGQATGQVCNDHGHIRQGKWVPC